MKLTKSKLQQIIKEEVNNILEEQKEKGYRLIIGAAFCMGPCVATMRVVEAKTSKVVAASKGKGKTKEEAFKIAKIQLVKQLSKLGLDINKIPRMK